MSNTFDAVIIGAGHNGLVTAAYLARAGLRVLVLERRELIGGAAVTEEFYPGFRVDTGAHRIGWLLPDLVQDLELTTHGLRVVHANPTAFSPLLDGRHLALWRESQVSGDAIRRFSEEDAKRWGPFCALLGKTAGFLKEVYTTTPASVPGGSARDLVTLAGLGRSLRRLGKKDMVEVLRLLPMSVAELVDDWFETDVLKGTIAASGITGVFQGPMAAGTAYVLLHHHLGSRDGIGRSTNVVLGGISNLTRSLAAAAKMRGAELRTEAEVRQVLVKDGKAEGVVLADGEEIISRLIVSNADPKRTFLQLIDPGSLDPDFLHKIRNIRFRGACAKVHLALGELPSFTCLPGAGAHLHGVISISPSVEYLERAYDDAKYGDVSNRPYLELFIPSLTDPSMAPEGKHVMSVLMQYAPYHLRSGEWDSAKREALGDSVVQTLSEYAPNLDAAILHRHVLSPLDLEEIYGLTEGNIYHGELTLDQSYFMRPAAGWARYRTPIENFYLCGAGTHPGGGVMGIPGYNAAREILRDNKQRS